MGDTILDEAHFRRLIESIDKLTDHTDRFERIVTSAAPVFLAAFLGFLFGLGTEWLKTRRVERKSNTEREERELSQLNVISSVLWFNLEEMLHVTMQMILPHRQDSHAAALAFAKCDETKLREFSVNLSERFPFMMMRSPVPNVIDVDLFKEIPFAVEHDPELLKLSGWITSYANDLRNSIEERNKWINRAAEENFKGGFSSDDIREQIRIQSHLGDVEVVNSLMYIRTLRTTLSKLDASLKRYSHLKKTKLKGTEPEALPEAMRELERLAKEIRPDLPPNAEKTDGEQQS